LKIASDVGDDALKSAATGTDIASVEITPAEMDEPVTPPKITEETIPVESDKKTAGRKPGQNPGDKESQGKYHPARPYHEPC